MQRDVGSYVHRVAEQIDDFSLLRELTAFRKVEDQVVALRHKGASEGSFAGLR